MIERGVAIRERTLGPAHPLHADDLHTLAKLSQREGDYDVAAQLYEQAIEMTQARFGAGHPWIVRNLRDYAGLLRQIGQSARATELESRAEAAAAGDQTPRTRRDSSSPSASKP